MRIALVVQGGLDRTGRERVVPSLLGLVERLARRHEVHVFALRHESAPCHYVLVGARIHDLGGAHVFPGFGLLQLVPRLLRWLREYGPFDVIHAYRGGPGFIAALISGVLGLPLVLTLDGGELVGLPDIGYGLQLRWRDRFALWIALRRASRVTVSSSHMRRLASTRGIYAEEIAFGVDASVFAPGEPPAPPPWRLLQVASLNRVKDQATLLRAVRAIADVEPRFHLDIVGQDTLRGELQAESQRLDIQNYVTFHGFLPTTEVVGLIQRAHVFVVSSRHEAGPVAVLEAAACGVPTIGTAVGHVADWAPDLALAVPVGDPLALAESILILLRDEGRRRRLGRAARAWALSHDADWTACRFEALYSSPQVVQADDGHSGQPPRSDVVS